MGTEIAMRLVDAELMTMARIASNLSSGREFEYEKLPLNPSFDVALLAPSTGSTKWTAEREAELAVIIHQVVVELRQVEPSIAKDNGFWIWLGLTHFRDYVVERWCSGWSPEGGVRKFEGCRYFLSGDSLRDQSRCAVRRLWIAADTSQRCDATYDNVLNLLRSTDLYVGIFERMLGLDPELAVEIALQTQTFERIPSGQSVEDLRRAIARMVGVVLSTIAIEFLGRPEKARIVRTVIEELTSE